MNEQGGDSFVDDNAAHVDNFLNMNGRVKLYLVSKKGDAIAASVFHCTKNGNFVHPAHHGAAE